MQQIDIEKLKEQIKAELLADMARTRDDNPHWTEIKQIIRDSFPKLPTYDYYQIINGLSPVVRFMFGVKRINHINAEQAEGVKAAVKLLIDAAKKGAVR